MSEKVQTALRDWLQRSLPKQSLIAKVTSVDETQFTCDVDPVDGSAAMHDVRLKPVIDDDSSGFIAIPEVGSDVIVAIANNNENDAYVTVMGKVKKYLIKTKSGAIQEWKDDGTILLNSDTYGGLVKVQELSVGLDKNNLILNTILNVIKLAPIPEPGSGSPSAFQQALSAAVAALQVGDFSQIENKKVKHGGGI